MVIIINGSVGVGKSSVSWELLEKFNHSVMLDGDHIGAVHPFKIYDEHRIEYLYQTIEHLVKFHLSNGYEHFVVNYVFETPQQLTQLSGRLERLNLIVRSFLLTCDEEQQKERVMKRGREGLDWEMERYRKLNNILNEAKRTGDIGREIDTTGKSIPEVVEEIWSLCTDK